MTVTPVPVTGFPVGGQPYTNVAPVTYRDGLTYAEVLEQMRDWLKNTLVPWINATVGDLNTEWQNEVSALVETVNAALVAQATQVNTDLANQSATVTTQLAENVAYVDAETAAMVTYVNDAVQSIINSTIAVSDPVINAVLTNIATTSRATIFGFIESAAVTKNDILLDVRDWGAGSLVENDTAAATANTAKIQAALDSAFYKKVYVPEGLYYINALSVPANKELTGEYSRSYTSLPTTGTRLRCATAAQTTPVVTLNGRSKLTNIGVFGTGGTPSHPVVKIASNGPVIRDAAIGYGNLGVDGNYCLAILDNVHVYQNTGNAVADIVDGKVYNCTINNNGAAGVYGGSGANATEYMNNRVEWNNGHGFNLTSCSQIQLIGNIVDRNGKTGIRLASCSGPIVLGNLLWRNGKLSAATPADDANLYIQSNVRAVIIGNRTSTGEDDGGGGYLSPLVAVRSQSNTDCTITGNDFLGGTSVSYDSIAANITTQRYGNKMLAGETDTYSGLSEVASASLSSIATTATGSATVTLPKVSTNSTGRVYEVDISSRDHGTGAARACTVKLVVSRGGSSDAAATLAGLVNLLGTAYGLTGSTYNVTASTNSDGTSVTLNVENTSANTVSFVIRIK